MIRMIHPFHPGTLSTLMKYVFGGALTLGTQTLGDLQDLVLDSRGPGDHRGPLELTGITTKNSLNITKHR